MSVQCLFQVDESEVEILTMTPCADVNAPSVVESYRYPRAGKFYNTAPQVKIQSINSALNC